MNRAILLLSFFLVYGEAFPEPEYPWKPQADKSNSISERVPVPPGFERVQAEAGSFAEWLRSLPLKPGKPDVMLFNGRPKATQEDHIAVVDIDVGTTDLQQCTDAIIRLRAEYLFSRKRFEDIRFNFTSGDMAFWTQWRDGWRPRIGKKNKVDWIKTAPANASRKTFREYLDSVFMYAGTCSLSKELNPVDDVAEIRVGDVFINEHCPSIGHAVIVVDVAENAVTRQKIFLLAQSYMPAQDIHVLKNPNPITTGSPWYSTEFEGQLETPEWTFEKRHLKRFPAEEGQFDRFFDEWQRMERGVRDGLVSCSEAMEALKELHGMLNEISFHDMRISEAPIRFFPLRGYKPDSIGGKDGSGYEPSGYDFCDGNRHTGHPGQDIFVRDANQDSIDDKTGEEIEVLSVSDGIVVSTNRNWKPESDIRGGNYIWIFNPTLDGYLYYAHLNRVFVQKGQAVKAGKMIATLGRTGKKAHPARSPTHLHLMFLKYENGRLVPKDIYNELTKTIAW